MVQLRITRGVIANGAPQTAGTVVEVSEADASTLLNVRAAEHIGTAPQKAAPGLTTETAAPVQAEGTAGKKRSGKKKKARS